MLQELTIFVMKHWVLCGAFSAVSILLIIEEVRSQGPSAGRLSAAEVTQLINREEAIVIDVRDAAVFRESHIVNAKNITLVDFDRSVEKLNRDRPIILVDAMGEKTAGLMVRLKKAGFQKIFALKNGMDGWKSAEMPTVKGK